MISKLLFVGLGGFIGALMRYGMSGLVQALSRCITFPYGTLAINLLGCLLIGALSQLAESQTAFSLEAREFIFVGILGAFTTFSTFSNETYNLIQHGDILLAFSNIGMHLVLGLWAIWLGHAIMV